MMHPSVSRELIIAHQQDELRAAASRRLVAEARNARRTANPAPRGTLATLVAQLTVMTLRPRKLFRLHTA
jgi:hypothetical protein